MELSQKMISSRRGTITLSVIAAVVAGALILVYVNRYRNSVKAEGAPVTVLVARHTIPRGTAGNVIASGGFYSAMTIRQGQVLEGAFSDPSSLRGKVATHDIASGGQLKAADFAAASTNLVASLTDRQRIITIAIDAAHGSLGVLQPGDRVDVYVGFNAVPVRFGGSAAAVGVSHPVIRRMLTNVLVVAVGGKTTGVLANGNTNVSFKLTDQEAANLAFASDNGRIWLTPRPSAGATNSAPNIVSMETLLLGVPPQVVLKSLGGR